jgi:hypothetical protein
MASLKGQSTGEVDEAVDFTQDHEEKDFYIKEDENIMVPDESVYADKYVEDMFDVLNDPDCMEGELDFLSPDFSVD